MSMEPIKASQLVLSTVTFSILFINLLDGGDQIDELNSSNGYT